MVTTIPVGMHPAVSEVLAAIEADQAQGAVGVVLEVSGWSASQHGDQTRDTAAQAIPRELVTAAAQLTAVTVTVGSPEQAEVAFHCGATGIMVRSAAETRFRSVVAAHGGRIWLTGVTDPTAAGRTGEHLTLECTVRSLPGTAGMAAGVGKVDPSGRYPDAVRLACALPRSTSLDDGALEALVTLAIAGGATVLRCAGSTATGGGDVRLVRRCADVAMELVGAGLALDKELPGGWPGQGVAS